MRSREKGGLLRGGGKEAARWSTRRILSVEPENAAFSLCILLGAAGAVDFHKNVHRIRSGVCSCILKF